MPSPSRSVSGSVEGGTKPPARPNRCLKVAAGLRDVPAPEGGAGHFLLPALSELPSGLPAHRAAILLTCCLHFIVGSSFLPSRASLLLARCLLSGGDGDAPTAPRVAAAPLSGPVLQCPPLPLRTCGLGGTRCSGVGTFRDSSEAVAPHECPACGHLLQVPGTSFGLFWIVRFVCD